jgi:L-ascorbate metabolism protein UlaG (beta-lactamase superfamily)
MRFTYYGHSCFELELQGKKVLFDPYITPNELAKNIDIKSITADFILVSHGHGDHLNDCVSLAKQTNATVVSSFEIINWLTSQGVKHTHPMNHGGKKEFEFGVVKCVNAIHSSGLPDGSYGGNPMGFVVTGSEKSFYFSGDTALTTDMQLIPLWAKLDFAILCIGDNFTMGYEDAIEAARMVQCDKVIGVHYDTFPYIKIDHQQVKQAFSETGMTLLLPEIGESIDL